MNTKSSTSNESPLPDDLLRGGRAIADFIGDQPRNVYHQAVRGYLPIGRVGSILVASKKELLAHFARITGARPAK